MALLCLDTSRILTDSLNFYNWQFSSWLQERLLIQFLPVAGLVGRKTKFYDRWLPKVANAVAELSEQKVCLEDVVRSEMLEAEQLFIY